VASSHPPARTAPAGVSPEFFLVVLFFDLRRLHGLREGQRQHVAAIGRGLAAFLHVGLAFEQRAVISTEYPKTLYHPGYPTGGATGMMVKDFRDEDANQEIWKYDAALRFGAKKWKPDNALYLKGKHVIILHDNDADGEAHRQIVAATLVGIAASITIVELPGLWNDNSIAACQKSDMATSRSCAFPAGHFSEPTRDSFRIA
jgi:hypothetical protein